MWNDSFGPARQHGSNLHCSRHWFLEPMSRTMKMRTMLMFGFRLSLKPFFLSLGPCSGPQSCTSFNAWFLRHGRGGPHTILDSFLWRLGGMDFWVFLSCPGLFFVERFEVHPMFRLQRPRTRSHHRNVQRTTSTTSGKQCTAWHISIHCLQRPGERYGVRMTPGFCGRIRAPKG